MAPPHGKVHSGLIDSRKSALCDPQIAQTAPFRDVAAPGRCRTTPRQAAGHYGKRPNWANALEQPPASLRGGLRQGPQISVRSLASRKGALCPTGGFRMRFSVMPHMQNALFRRVRLSSPGQTWRHLTEKRILLPASHGKAHSATYVSRKAALCHPQIAQLCFSVTCRLQTAPFRHVAAPGVWGNPPPACGAACVK